MKMEIATLHGTVLIRHALKSDALALREIRLEALRSHPDAFWFGCQRPLPFWEEM